MSNYHSCSTLDTAIINKSLECNSNHCNNSRLAGFLWKWIDLCAFMVFRWFFLHFFDVAFVLFVFRSGAIRFVSFCQHSDRKLTGSGPPVGSIGAVRFVIRTNYADFFFAFCTFRFCFSLFFSIENTVIDIQFKWNHEQTIVNIVRMAHCLSKP